MAGDAGSLWGTLGLYTKDFLDALKGSNDAVADASKDQTSHFEDIGGSLTGLSKAVAGLGIGATIVELGKKSLEAYDTIAKLHSGFVNLNGATEETEKIFKDISEMELKSNFDFEDVLGPAAKQMLTLGVNATDTTKYMQNIVDTVAGLKLPAEAIPGIATAIGRMSQETELSTKTMKQLQAEGVPAWKLLADAMGTDIPTAMAAVKKGAISSKDAIAAITDGMAEKWGGDAEKASKTFKGAMNQLDQATEDIEQTIGQSLRGLLNNVVAPALSGIVEWIKLLADWFKNLSEPVRNAIVAFAALVAGIGALAGAWASITAAVAFVGPALATIAAALSWPVLAIAALVAALVGFGVWVHENWEPIVAVLTLAWADIKEAWMGVWTPMVDYLTKAWAAIVQAWHTNVDPLLKRLSEIWNAVADYFAAAWDAIAQKMNSVWSALRDAGTKVWSYIVDAMKKFLDFASKIPGVGKLLDGLTSSISDTSDSLKKMGSMYDSGASKVAGLGKAWDDAKAKSAAAKAAAEANTRAEKEAAEANDQGTISLKTHATATELAKGKTLEEKQAKDDQRAAALAEKQVRDDATKSLQNYIKYLDAQQTAHEKATLAAAKQQSQLKDITLLVVDETVPAVADLNAQVDGTAAVLEALQTPVYDAASGLKYLGVTSKQTFEDTTKEAYAAYQAVLSGGATQWEKDSAYLAYLKKVEAAQKATGETLSAQQKADMDRLNKELGGQTTQMTTTWDSMSKQVSTVITNFAQDMAKTLWDGDQSWGEKFKNLWGSLRDAVTSTFLEPVTKAMNDFISGVIGKLLGGEGFGGIGDVIGGLAGKIGGLFGVGGGGDGVQGGDNLPLGLGGAGSGLTNLLSKIPGLGGLAGAAGSAGSAISGIMGSITSALNPIGMIGSAIGGVAQVLQLFGVGQGGEKDRMNNIANDTRFLAWCFDTGRVYLNIWDIRSMAFEMSATLHGIADAMSSYDIAGLRNDLSANGWLAGLATSMNNHLASIDAATVSASSRSVVIQISPQGLTTAEAARALGNQIASNLTGQLVAI